jgi:16S rRNA (uracil1498-N3)-methyltransferase
MPTKSVRVDRRFLVKDLGAAGDEAVLDADEAHHLVRVLRLGTGDQVAVFDGRGREFLARVSGTGRSHATVTLLDQLVPAAEPRVPFSVAQAVLKAAAMDDVIRDATMVGATAIEPIVTSHVDVRSSVFSKTSALDRWRRIALASVKQCRRAVVPAVLAPRSLREWLASATWDLRLILVEPSAAVETTPLRELRRREAPESCALMIGPEGGWELQEIEAAASAGAVAVTLGSLTLRADSMALAAGILLRSLWEDW